MRRFLLFFCLLLSGLAWPDAEPADIGLLEKRSGPQTFQPLEMLNAATQSDMDFFDGSLTYFTIPGQRSPVRFAANEPVELFLRILADLRDPRAEFFPVRDPNCFQLYKTLPEGPNRRVLLREDGAGYSKGLAGKPLVASLFGQSSFALRPGEPLAPGEYAIVYPTGHSDQARLFCFGVDGK